MNTKMVSSEPPAPDYPVWKKVLWRFIRISISSGISSALTIQVVLQPDWSNGKATLLAISAGFVSGALSAGFMYLRDVVSEGDYNAPINKFPL